MPKKNRREDFLCTNEEFKEFIESIEGQRFNVFTGYIICDNSTFRLYPSFIPNIYIQAEKADVLNVRVLDEKNGLTSVYLKADADIRNVSINLDTISQSRSFIQSCVPAENIPCAPITGLPPDLCQIIHQGYIDSINQRNQHSQCSPEWNRLNDSAKAYKPYVIGCGYAV